MITSPARYASFDIPIGESYVYMTPFFPMTVCTASLVTRGVGRCTRVEHGQATVVVNKGLQAEFTIKCDAEYVSKI